MRQGEPGYCRKRRKIDYSNARYIIAGNVKPAIVPRMNFSNWYYKKFGKYINVLSEERKLLFTVRYSEEVLLLIQQKCEDAELVMVD